MMQAEYRFGHSATLFISLEVVTISNKINLPKPTLSVISSSTSCSILSSFTKVPFALWKYASNQNSIEKLFVFGLWNVLPVSLWCTCDCYGIRCCSAFSIWFWIPTWHHNRDRRDLRKIIFSEIEICGNHGITQNRRLLKEIYFPVRLATVQSLEEQEIFIESHPALIIKSRK